MSGERTRTQDWLDATGGYVDRTIVRDANGNVDRERDRLGAETDHAYDASGRLRLGTTNAVGDAIAFAWEPVCEEPATITDPGMATSAGRHAAPRRAGVGTSRV